MRGVSVFFVLFTLAFTTGWTSSGSLLFIGCFILVSQVANHPTIDNGVGASSLEIRTGFVFKVGYPVVTSHFAATPPSDVVRICAHDFQRHGDAFGTTENACFRAFIILISQFHLHHCSQRTLTKIV